MVLFPVAVTFFVTWWFVQFFDGFFSPIYERLGVDIFGESSLQYLTLIPLGFAATFFSSCYGSNVMRTMMLAGL